MNKCGCLNENQKLVAIEALTVYQQSLSDTSAIANLEIIKSEIKNCTCESASTSTSKKGRILSKWQTFLKTCIPSQSKDLAFPQKIKQCSIEYKKMK